MALRQGLVELPTKIRELADSESTSKYRVTSVGAYYVKMLITQFAYVDAMVVDTPVVDPAMRAKIANVYGIADRLARARVFCEYLNLQWCGLVGHQLAFEWPPIKESIERDIKWVFRKIPS